MPLQAVTCLYGTERELQPVRLTVQLGIVLAGVRRERVKGAGLPVSGRGGGKLLEPAAAGVPPRTDVTICRGW